MLTGSKQRNNKTNKNFQINLSFKKTVCVGEVIIIICIQGLCDVVALFESLCPVAFYYVAKFIQKINYTCTVSHFRSFNQHIHMNNMFEV